MDKCEEGRVRKSLKKNSTWKETNPLSSDPKGSKLAIVSATFRATDLLFYVYSEKCTGLYFKVSDDDLSSKQGSLCTFKMIPLKISLVIIFKRNMNIFLC